MSQFIGQLIAREHLAGAAIPRDLREQIHTIQRQITMAESMFNIAEDDCLIDAYAYQLMALHSYRDYLLQMVRQPAEIITVEAPLHTVRERIGGTMG